MIDHDTKPDISIEEVCGTASPEVLPAQLHNEAAAGGLPDGLSGRLFPLFTMISRKMQEKNEANTNYPDRSEEAAGKPAGLPDRPVIISVEGRCASGKTTLAAQLAESCDCNVFHMDDFFLRPEQRTPERLSVPGENVDHERFLEEVMKPLAEGRTVRYRRYDCHHGRMEAAVEIAPKPIAVVEGVYSCHKDLIDYYDIRVFLEITPEEQRRRIRIRNTPEMAERFFAEWIPLEERYFDTMRIREQAELIIKG